MREETKKRLNQAIWRDRLRMAGIGLAVLAAIGAIMFYQTYDLSETKTQVGGTVTAFEPLVTKSVSAATDGVKAEVRLDSGPLISVFALKSRGLKVGDHIEVTAHNHGSGRVNYSFK